MSIHLTHSHIAKLATFTSILLSPLDVDSIDDWRRAACRALASLIEDGDQFYFLAAPLPGVDVLWAEGMPESLRLAYAAHFMEDEGTNRALRSGVSAFNQTLIVAGDWNGYRHDPMVNELFLPHGVHDTIGLLTEVEADPATGGSFCRFHLGAARAPYGSELFGDVGLAMMRLAAPAFEAGVATLLAAGTWRTSLAGAFDALSTAAWVFSARGDKVIHRNASAGLLMDEDVQSDLLEDAVSSVARELARSANPTKSSGGRVLNVDAKTTVRTAHASYVLRGSYVGAARLGPTRTILVVARRTSPTSLDTAGLRERYLLSKRELQVASLIVEGLNAPEIAIRLGISIHTTRRHLEQLYRKLGAHSRSEAQGILRSQSPSRKTP
jgi:DNA-binding CsgD family transcriptional regulator